MNLINWQWCGEVSRDVIRVIGLERKDTAQFLTPLAFFYFISLLCSVCNTRIMSIDCYIVALTRIKYFSGIPLVTIQAKFYRYSAISLLSVTIYESFSSSLYFTFAIYRSSGPTLYNF